MYQVNQPWDPLKVCAVGRSYPPEWYQWITVPHVRRLFEKIAVETEEDFQNLISVLKKFNVEIIRPDLSFELASSKKEIPPMCPRDHMIMIGNCLYHNSPVQWQNFYASIKDPAWPEALDFESLPSDLQAECLAHGWQDSTVIGHPGFKTIFQHCQQKNIPTKISPFSHVNGAYTTRIGKDLFFGTDSQHDNISKLRQIAAEHFPDYRTHVIDTRGHSDGTFCPVVPGLIVSLYDITNYHETFPGWEVVYLENQGFNKVEKFLEVKEKNRGKWWIPGFEHDTDVVNTVEHWLSHWTGYVEETVFDVNMLVIDPKNVVVFGYNEVVFKAFSRYNITPHIVPLRHRYFWDGGIHCVTADLARQGTQQDFFPNT